MNDKIIQFLIDNQNSIELPWNPMLKRNATNKSKIAGRTAHRGDRIQLGSKDVTVVLWHEGLITLQPMSSETDALSFEFSGCTMARFLLKGVYYTAHIHTSDEIHYLNDCKDEWIDYVWQQGITVLTMFRPDYLRLPNNEECWGLISQEGNCYTIGVELLQDRSNRFFKINSIYQHIGHKHSVFDYLPLLEHGTKLTLEEQKNPNLLKQRFIFTRSNWEKFWRDNKIKTVDRTTTTPSPKSRWHFW